jgi:hypothetical protein
MPDGLDVTVPLPLPVFFTFNEGGFTDMFIELDIPPSAVMVTA